MRKYRKSIRKKRKTIRKRRMTTKRRTNKKHRTNKKQPTTLKSTIHFESDYQNLRLRYLRANKKRTKDENSELSYLESLLKSLQKKQNK